MSVSLQGKVYWTDFQVNGKRIRENTGKTSKKAAQSFEVDLKKRIRAEAKTVNVKTYGDAVLRWLPESPDSMQSHIRNTLPHLQHVALTEIIPAVYGMQAEMLARGLSNLTVNRRLSVVKRVLNLAFKWEWIDVPLAGRIEKLSEANSQRDITASKSELESLIAAMSNETVIRMTILACYTGMRRGEQFKLKPGDWTPPYLTLRKTKGGKPRRIPVPQHAHDLIVLPFAINENTLRYQFEKARAAIGRPELRFNDLRHTYGTWLAENPDVPITMIRDLLGHSSLAMTSRYVNVRNATADMIEKALG